ncbi:23S rRNA (uracil(1939)-C(5))-methyltransferase RlmD [bacterium]|nr:23S rRNA (uracil(1939)-C(5))-methyltransferase RlmD [bacterium]
MNINDEYIVKIDKLINEGQGFAKINGIPVFIDNACPQDVLKIKIKKVNKHFLTAEYVEIIEPSPYRVKPVCSLFNVCGSCTWQHIEYSQQLIQKQNIVKETIKSIAGVDFEVKETIPSPKIQEYRCKVQMPVSQTKVSKRILSGYYKKNSHELINIKYCPMQPEIINKISEYIKENSQNLNITGYNEKNNRGLLRHIVYRLSSDNNNILIVFVLNSNVIDNSVKQISEKIMSVFPEVKGICANFNTQKTNVILGKSTHKIIGNDFYIEKLDNIKYKVSAGSFFQVNPLCAMQIFNKVKELISDNCTMPTILDAYSGVSSFGIWLSSIASKVVSIEEVQSASNDANYNAELNNIKNIEIINGDAGAEFEKLQNRGIKFDVSIIDPPRKGCTDESINNLVKLTSKYIVYVSCNVSTLARDVKKLSEYGFNVKYIQPVDMFPNTSHIETIVMLEKTN